MTASQDGASIDRNGDLGADLTVGGQSGSPMAIANRSGNASDGSTATLTECQSTIVALIGVGLTNQEIIGWIADLRARLDRGDLATLAPVDVGHGTDILSAQDTIRIMRADLDGFD